MPSVQIRLAEFEDLIEGYTAGFVGRKWLVKEVDFLLADPDCRFVVLTGGPGVGKSAFMAHLAATHHQWLRYFIRRDSRELLSPSDGKTFLLTVGGQLATLQPDLFKPEKLEVVVRQRIGDLEPGGEAVGVRIKELRASPFYSVSVKAEQRIQRVAGKATGVEIGRLVTEPRSLTMQDLQFMGLLDPAWLLYQTDREARIVVLVDALDELRFSPAEADILDALCQLPIGQINREGPKSAAPAQKLSQIPPNLRFVISSRREKFLDRLLRRSDVRELPLSVVGDENRKDLWTYAKVNLPKDPLELVLARENRTIDEFVTNLLEKAAGNFLYLRSVLGAIQEALAEPEKSERLHSLLLVEDLPDDLASLYRYFLNSIVDWVNRCGFGEAAWRKHLRPLLGVLAVAREPLKERELLAFTGLDSEDLGDLLRELRQFVEPENGQHAFRIYHASFAEYLLDDVTNVDYRIDGLKSHKRIADFYRGKARSWTKVNWNKVDDYGVRHLGIHLYALRDDPGQGGELYALLCKPYMWAKFGRTGSHGAFGQDVNLALDAARHKTPPDLVQVARACFLSATLGNISAIVPSELLGVLAQLGERASALGYAVLISDAAQRGNVYLKIAEAISSEVHGKELLDIVDMALLAVETISNEAIKAGALIGVAQALMRMGEKERAQSAAIRAFEAAKMLEKEGVEAEELRVLAETMLQAGEYARALEVSEMISDEPVKTEILSGLVRALAQAGKHDQALEVTETIKDKKVKVEALSSLAQTLIEIGRGERARNAAKRAFEVLKKIEDRWIKEGVQDRVVQALTQAGDHDQALKVAETSGDSRVKAVSLAVLAQALAQTGDSARAQGTAGRALQVAETIEDEMEKAETLAKVAGVLVTMGERELARSTAERVLEVMKTIENELAQAMAAAQQREMEQPKSRAEAIDQTRYATRRRFGVQDKMVRAEKVKADAARVFAQAIARPGDYDLVLEVVENIKDEGVKAELQTGLTHILMQDGEYDLALEMAGTIEWELRRATALTGLAQELVRIGKEGLARSALGGAFAIATEISVNKSPGTQEESLSVLARLAQTLMQVGEHDRALEVTEMIGNGWSKADELRALAQTLAQTTEGGRARSTARRALEAVKSIGDERVKAEALTRLAEVLVQMGKKERARSVARRALEAVEKIKVETGSDEWDKATALSDVAQVLVQVREYDRLLEVAETIGEGVRKEKVLTGLAQALVLSGEYDRGLDVAEMIPYEEQKAKALTVLAQALVRMGEKERALRVASRALESVGGAWDVDTVNESLKVLAHVIGQMGEGAQARRAARQVLERLKTIWNASTKARALTELARVFVDAGEYDGVLEVADTIGDEQVKVRALSRVVQTLMQMGEKERAQSVARRVLEVVDKIDNEWEKSTALSDAAQALMQVGEYDRALGVADMIRDPGSQAKALNGLAQASVELGEKELARSAATRVLEVAKTVGDRWAKMEAQSGAAQVLVRVGEYEQGLKVVGMLPDKGDQARALTGLAEQLLQMGEGERAQSTARRALIVAEETSGNEGVKSEAKTVLVQALLQLGQYDEVSEVLGRYYMAPEGLSGVAQALAQAGEYKRALEVVEEIAHGTFNPGVVRVLAELVHALVQMEQNELARTAASWALEVGEKLEHKGVRAQELSWLAQVLVKARKYDWALEVAERIRDEEVKAKALSGVAQALLDAGDYDRALEVAETIGHEGIKADALAEWAQLLIHTRADEARQIVIQALDSGRLHSRDALFSVLSKSAGTLAQLDPESVWGISEAIAEIDAW